MFKFSIILFLDWETASTIPMSSPQQLAAALLDLEEGWIDGDQEILQDEEVDNSFPNGDLTELVPLQLPR
jgi:hypothetical protein